MDSFVFGKKLGSGKFGDVYIAMEKQTGFKVAIKQIKKVNIKKLDAYEDIINELKALQILDHPNIIKLYGYFYENDTINIIQQIAPGKELFAELQAQVNKRFNEQTVSNYIKQIIHILLYVHQQGFIHRDIKPENILICDGVIKLCDFGCAGIIQKDQMRQTFCGTLDYLSPEMAQGKSYDQSVDVWSIGILTYELIFGRSPFYNQNHDAIIGKVINGSVQFGGPVSFDAADFIQKMLCKDPKKRILLNDALQHPFILNQSKKNAEYDIISLNDQAFLYRK
ncbi:protein kinase domain protein [Ichthyophthirius multifiliis]|uniref:Aurora kinase n=1 Tax=Ichthyophthirius multifiliis TaxID=5932 RepID=G0QUF3_ICHMU|nr:protein kinase domain protein [Ichthyophthirius multifiliis]EGR31149.1 protein kinase domain protein [Ichthyophthirius multifiliis]|eukprot:XP_004034635.1 protein kinase domain protein [Ichthyophthirius multifiliis]